MDSLLNCMSNIANMINQLIDKLEELYTVSIEYQTGSITEISIDLSFDNIVYTHTIAIYSSYHGNYSIMDISNWHNSVSIDVLDIDYIIDVLQHIQCILSKLQLLTKNTIECYYESFNVINIKINGIWIEYEFSMNFDESFKVSYVTQFDCYKEYHSLQKCKNGLKKLYPDLFAKND